MKKDEMDRACGMCCGRRGVDMGYWLRESEGEETCEDLGVDGRMI